MKLNWTIFNRGSCSNEVCPSKQYFPFILVQHPDIWCRLNEHIEVSTTRPYVKVKLKCSRYRSGVVQRVGRGIALLFKDHGTRSRWVVSSTPRPHFTPGKDSVPIVQEAGWAPEPVWMGGKSRPHRHSIPDLPVRSQSLYRLSYPAHTRPSVMTYIDSIVYLTSDGRVTTNCLLQRNWIDALGLISFWRFSETFVKGVY